MPMRSRQKSFVPSTAADVSQTVVAGEAAAELELELPGGRSSSSWQTRIRRRQSDKAREHADRTARLFMNVWGLSSQAARGTRATSPGKQPRA